MASRTSRPSGSATSGTKSRKSLSVVSSSSSGASRAAPPSPLETGTETGTTGNAPPTGPTELKKKELIASVLQRSDVKKKYAKPVIEAMIEVIGEAIAAEREINLQPMGKIKPQRSRDSATARVVMAKIRQNKPAGAGPTEDETGGGDNAADKTKRVVAGDAKGR